MKKNFRIISRQSALALWQSNFVKTQLETLYPTLSIDIIGITTEGDKIQDLPLHKLGGKGLFVKELEQALLKKEADIAIHSMKDVPATLPEELEIAAILAREDPRDAFVSTHYTSLSNLPKNALVGTSSLRRQAQLTAIRGDLSLVSLRGNIDTRIAKLDKGEFDAIILAVAGLKRLSLEKRILEYFSSNTLLPAVGQGALGIECRRDDKLIQDLILPLHHLPSAYCVLAERSMNAILGGSCQLPVAALATLDAQQQLTLRAKVSTLDGKTILNAKAKGLKNQYADIGRAAAVQLLQQGAQAIIDLYEGKTP
jgi:hydroxymethylbilane synthase